MILKERDFVEAYRDPGLIRKISAEIAAASKKKIRLMEVCGGHTHAIHKHGLLSFLPENIELLSGPGCPVCVSSQGFIDRAVALSNLRHVIIATYGDMMRVPGTHSSLERKKAEGNDIRMVYSVLEALETAKRNKTKEVIFLGIGFETTAPSSAAAILLAEREGIKNFYLLSAHKIMPPALEALVMANDQIHGFIAPGHVSSITGYAPYKRLTDVYHRAVVISGFEPVDIMLSVYLLVGQVEKQSFRVENEYTRAVRPEGNKQAQEVIKKVFVLTDAEWRGIGVIPGSGLGISGNYSSFDALTRFEVSLPEAVLPVGCICGEIMRGRKSPEECRLFTTVCTPASPVGACMVSDEGTCSIYFKYRSR